MQRCRVSKAERVMNGRRSGPHKLEGAKSEEEDYRGKFGPDREGEGCFNNRRKLKNFQKQIGICTDFST